MCSSNILLVIVEKISDRTHKMIVINVNGIEVINVEMLESDGGVASNQKKQSHLR
jgi:hypothetical protein